MTINLVKWPVADAGCSGWMCAMCGHAITRVEALRVGRDLDNCPTCQAEIFASEMPTKMLADTKRFFDPESVKSTSWFHASLSPTWHDDVCGEGVPVHVGTYASALMRSRDLRDIDEVGNTERSIWTVYEVEVAPDALVMPEVHMDSDGAWPETLVEMVSVAGEHDVVRYLNRYEDPGSISLLVNAAVLKVVNSRTFRAQELDTEMTRVYL